MCQGTIFYRKDGIEEIWHIIINVWKSLKSSDTLILNMLDRCFYIPCMYILTEDIKQQQIISMYYRIFLEHILKINKIHIMV